MQKGISPLIAAVLLVAFTLAIAGIVSQFLTSTTTEQTTRAGEQGDELVDCGNTIIKILDNSTRFSPNLFLTIENQGAVSVSIPEIITYNATNGVATTSSVVKFTGGAITTTSPLTSGSIVTINATAPVINGSISKIVVRTGCSGKTASIQNDTVNNEWDTVFE